MKITIPIQHDSFNTYTDNIELVFDECQDTVAIYIDGGGCEHSPRTIIVSKAKLTRVLEVLKVPE